MTRGSLYSAQGNSSAAIADFNRVIELDAYSSAAYEQRAKARLNNNNIAEAIADFDSALSLNPIDEGI